MPIGSLTARSQTLQQELAGIGTDRGLRGDCMSDMHLAVAWVHGFENRFEPPESGLKPLVSFVHGDHWTDEYWKPLYEGPNMLDITGAKLVEVKVSKNGKVLWVNVNGQCKLRICQIAELQVIGRNEP
jgi:hypothetical protein